MKKLLLLSCVIILFFNCSYKLTNPFLQTNLNINAETKAVKETDIDLVLNSLNNPGGTNSDNFWAIIESGDYYIAVGDSRSDLSGLPGGRDNSGDFDFVIAKFNKSDLSLVNMNNPGGTGYDTFKSIIESGDYYIAVGDSRSDLSGISGGSDNSGGYDFVIAKINKSDLSIETIHNFGDASTDYFYSVIESDGYYVAVGSSNSDLSSLPGGSNPIGGWEDFVIAKFNKADLSMNTINNIGGSKYDCLESVIESDDYYVGIGRSYSDLSGLPGGSNPIGGWEDFVIAKFNKADLSMNTINNTGGTSIDQLKSVIESESYYIATGYSQSDLSDLPGGSNTAGSDDFVIVRFNKSDLSVDLINNLGGSSSEYFTSVIESGDYYITAGFSRSDLSAFTGGSNTTGWEDFVIAKLNKTNLSLKDLINVGGINSDRFYSVIKSGNHYIATGYSHSDLSAHQGGSASENSDFVIAKFGN